MAKRGQHPNDASGQRSGRNNPRKSVTITAGTPKKRETYEEQARAHEDPAKPAQSSPAHASTTDHRGLEKPKTRASHPRSGRSGSDSNADSGTRGH